MKWPFRRSYSKTESPSEPEPLPVLPVDEISAILQDIRVMVNRIDQRAYKGKPKPSESEPEIEEKPHVPPPT
jgi:hypothetical protein